MEMDNNKLRLKGILHSLIGIAIGLTAYLMLKSVVLGTIVCVASAIVFLSAALFTKSIYVRINKSVELFAKALGRLLTWLVFILLYYLFFLPFGILFRKGKKDRLMRHKNQTVDTYWQTIGDSATETSRYERLF